MARHSSPICSRGLRLAADVIVVSLALLPVDVMLPGVGSVAIIGGGWLASRPGILRAGGPAASVARRGRQHARAPRDGHSGRGHRRSRALAIIPVVNFFAPLFGAAFMVHVFQHYQPSGAPRMNGPAIRLVLAAALCASVCASRDAARRRPQRVSLPAPPPSASRPASPASKRRNCAWLSARPGFVRKDGDRRDVAL